MRNDDFERSENEAWQESVRRNNAVFRRQEFEIRTILRALKMSRRENERQEKNNDFRLSRKAGRGIW